MPLFPTHPAARRLALGFTILAPLLYGLLSLAMGQDANWDLRNYHWYNAFAFLNNRLDFDILPAQTPTFYNPTMDLPFYLLATRFPARLVGFLLGMVQGLNGVLLFALAYRLLRLENPLYRTLAAIAIAIVGLLGGGTLAELGTTFYDNVISLGIFGALLAVAGHPELLIAGPPRAAFRRAALGGLLAGCAVGLKQPALLYAAGLGLALFVLPTPWRRRFGLAFWFGIGGLAGIALFSGHWIIHLARDYGNPMFPYFNDLFHSPFAELKSYRDDNFIPAALWRRLLLPLIFAFNPYSVGEVAWRDFAVPLLFLVLPAAFIMAWRRVSQPALSEPIGTRYVLAAAAISYLIWLKMFCIYRYLVPLEMIAPLALVLCIGWLLQNRRHRMFAAGGMLLFVLATMLPGNWGRTAWGDRYVQIAMPQMADDTMLLMAGWHPIGYAASAVPSSVPVIRIHSNFTTPDKPPLRFTALMHGRIAAHGGPLKVLFLPVEEQIVTAALAAYGLNLQTEACLPVPNSLDVDYRLCDVGRLNLSK